MATIPSNPPTSGQTGHLISVVNSATSTLAIRANGGTFTHGGVTCWYYDRQASTSAWYNNKLGFNPTTNTFFEASISGNPDQVYHNKTSSNVVKGSITATPNQFILSNNPATDPLPWSGAALFTNPFADPATVTWATGSQNRQLSVTFDVPTLPETYEIVETSTGTDIVHASQYFAQGGTTGTKTVTFTADTDVVSNSVWHVKEHGAATGTYINGSNGHNAYNTLVPAVGPATSSNVSVNSSGEITYQLVSTSNLLNTSGTDTDRWRVIAKDISTNQEMISPEASLLTGVNSITYTGFATNDYNNKDIRLQIRNAVHGNTTFHDFLFNHGNITLQSPYSAPFTISNPVWAPQNGNVISISWTETNPPPATGVELWKTNGSSAISSSTTGGPLTYTLQSASDNGTYELKYNGNVISTSGTFTYVPPQQGSVTVTNVQWTETGAGATGNTVDVSFTVANTTNSGAQFDLRTNETGQPTYDSDTVNAGQTKNVTLTNSNAGQSILHRVFDQVNGQNITPTFTTQQTTAGSVTVTGFTANSWSETNPGIPTNTVGVSFQVSNTTSNDAEFRLYNGGANEDQATMAAGQSGTITLTDANAGQSQLMRVMNVTDNNNYMSPTFTTAATSGGGGGGGGTTPTQSYAPAKGGRKRRFPIISTQLFNRQRSVYSIGTTHHEIAPQF